MSLLARIFGEHVKNAGEAITTAIVNFDPETATEAQIGELESHLEKVSLQLAQARRDYQKEKGEADAAQALYQRMLKAAEILQGQLDAAADADKPEIEKSLAKQIESLEAKKPDVDREQSEADEAKSYLEQLEQATQEMANQVKQARSVLEHARHEMERAEHDKDRAQIKEKNTKVLAGIKNGGAGMNTALEAMNKRTEALKTQAAAANIRTDLLKPSQPGEDDARIAEAMRQASGEAPKGSLSDRLAALKK